MSFINIENNYLKTVYSEPCDEKVTNLYVSNAKIFFCIFTHDEMKMMNFAFHYVQSKDFRQL